MSSLLQLKNPASNSRVLDLILECIENKEICLVGNAILTAEMDKYREAFNSPTASAVLLLLKQKTHLLAPKNETLTECQKYFPETQFKDAVHAATAMDANAVLVTNDKHFDKIKDTGRLAVWDIPSAIRTLLSKQ